MKLKAGIDIHELMKNGQMERHDFKRRKMTHGISKKFYQDGNWLGTAVITKTHGNQYVSWFIFHYWWPDKIRGTEGRLIRAGFKRKRK